MDNLAFEVQKRAPDQLWLKAAGAINASTLVQAKNFVTSTEDLIAQMHTSSGSLVRCVFDIAEVTEVKHHDAISLLAEFQTNNKPHILKTALVTNNPEIKLAIGVVGAMANRDNIQIFSDKESAEHWAFEDK